MNTKLQRIAPIAALAWAVAAGLFVLFGPLYASASGSLSVDGSGDNVASPVTFGYITALEVEGPWILVLASIPILLTLVPVFIPNRAVRIASGVLFLGLCFVAAMSIGIFYLPAALLVLASGIMKPTPAWQSLTGRRPT